MKICKKRSNLSQEFDFEHEFDHEDNKKSLNKYFKAENAIYVYKTKHLIEKLTSNTYIIKS